MHKRLQAWMSLCALSLRRYLRALLIAALPLIIAATQPSSRPEPSCDQAIALITEGYGADGPYSVEQQSVDNPSFPRQPVQVFLPVGAEGPRPVIFFAHGFGPNVWTAYKELIQHWVHRGFVVVYSTYPVFFSSQWERYGALSAGFEAAAEHFGARMDLTRVGFVGHSYGGGAAPALAYRGIVQRGWGKQGAFIASLAPWYTLALTGAQQRQLPVDIPQLVEVYEDDQTNDHRMAINLYNNAHDGNRYYFLVHSSKPDGCQIVADHSVPGRSPLLRLKQYAVFRPLDALAEFAWERSKAAQDALATMGSGKSQTGFEPLQNLSAPKPVHEESYYKWPWSSDRNMRRNGGY